MSRELLDDGGNESRERVRGADPDFARSPVGQKFDVPDALLQLVEGGNAALEKRATEGRRFDAAGASIDKPHAERMLEIGNDFGNGRLGKEKSRRLWSNRRPYVG